MKVKERDIEAILAEFVVLLMLLFWVTGCSVTGWDSTPLQKGEIRKVTTWCAGAVPLGTPVGACYWHSERGWGVLSEDSPDPGLPE